MTIFDIRLATSKEDINETFKLRQQVFVIEKQLFVAHDRDENDDNALYLNAWGQNNKHLVGTVRCYPDKKDPTIWWGGRLAVHSDYRQNRIGIDLIQTAVELVKHQKAERFFAHILLDNVALFEKLGWLKIDNPFDSHGQLHQLMEVDYDVLHSPTTKSFYSLPTPVLNEQYI